MKFTEEKKRELKAILIRRYLSLNNAAAEMQVDYQKLVKTIKGYYKDDESKRIIERIEKIGTER